MIEYQDIVFPFEYELERPITVTSSKTGESTIDAIEFREPRLGDLDGIKLGEALPMAKLFVVGAKLTGQKVLALKKLEGADARMLVLVGFGFFQLCLLGTETD